MVRPGVTGRHPVESRDLVSISDPDWHLACRRFNATQQLAKYRGRLQARIASIAKMFDVTDRTVRRWLAIYRKNPDIVALPFPRNCGTVRFIERRPCP
jgi:hypothetical protein